MGASQSNLSAESTDKRIRSKAIQSDTTDFPAVVNKSSACPVTKDISNEGKCPVHVREERPPTDSSETEATQSSSACPVISTTPPPTTEYDVYSQPIDPNNRMPHVANQLPAPHQLEALSTERVNSTIPKGGTDVGKTWTYPSSQMFYNALSRKNKLGSTSESDIESVVAIHNNMNEATWSKVLEWESLLGSDSDSSDSPKAKLLRFLGRPTDLSPKARIKSYLFDHPLPFDRHDWTVLRPDGSTARYVIDYYYDDSQASEEPSSGHPALHDRNAVRSILVDVRPALDTFDALTQRALRMPLERMKGTTKFTPVPMIPAPHLKSQVEESRKTWDMILQDKKRSAEKTDDFTTNKHHNMQHMTKEDATVVARSFAQIMKQCMEEKQKLDECDNEAELPQKSLAYAMCTAKLVCPLQHAAVRTSIDADQNASGYDATIDEALGNVIECVNGFDQQRNQAFKNYPNEFQNNLK